MLETMGFSLYKNKVAKYISGVVLACFIIPICSALPPRNVTDFHFATWNSHGGHWREVFTLMNVGNLELLAVQEAGSLPGDGRSSTTIGHVEISDKVKPPLPELPEDKIGDIPDAIFNTAPSDEFQDPPGLALHVLEYIWYINNQKFYIYYYDRALGQNLVEGPNNPASTQNMAIITRQRANRIFLMAPIKTSDNVGIIRPTIGVQLENSVFFNIHAESSNKPMNEAPAIVFNIEKYMAQNYKTLTWAITGDFNVSPNELDAEINRMPPPDHTFRQTVNTGQDTRPTPHFRAFRGTGKPKELDYGVIGGPAINYNPSISATLIMFILDNNNMDKSSDHKPVKFN